MKQIVRTMISVTANFRRITGWAMACLLFALTAKAQPGGGGGLHIIRLFDRHWRQILPSDSALLVRAFALKGGKPYQENFYDRPGYIRDSQRYWSPTYLLPQSDFDLYSSNRYLENDQRMVICYGTDTMLIDFLGITGENAMGYEDVIDSLVVMPGHFRYTIAHAGWWGHRLLSIVPGTPDTIARGAQLEYLGRVLTAFPDEATWGLDFYLSYARHLVHERQYAEALKVVERGLRNTGGSRNCPALLILSEAYAGLKRYDDALAALREGIYCDKGRTDGFKRNIDRAVALAWQSGRPAKALAFYDILARDADSLGVYERTQTDLLHDYRPGFQPGYERAVYIATAMHDEARARRQLQAIIDSIPRYYTGELADGNSLYSMVYFSLAGLEYKAGLRDAAYRHWLTGMEFQYARYDGGGNGQLFDSLILANGASPQLYLARALARFQNPVYRPGYDTVLDDLARVARLDSTDYRIDLYRARVLAAAGARDSALVFINRAIERAPGDPRLYLFRYEARNKTPPAVYENQWYPDLQRYHELSNSWNFGGYVR